MSLNIAVVFSASHHSCCAPGRWAALEVILAQLNSERSFRNLILSVLDTSKKPLRVLGELSAVEACELDSCFLNLQIALNSV